MTWNIHFLLLVSVFGVPIEEIFALDKSTESVQMGK